MRTESEIYMATSSGGFPPTTSRTRDLLETRCVHLGLQNQHLLEKVHERTVELEKAQLEILLYLARAAEYRDDNTGRHTQRVGQTSALIARALGLSQVQVELIRLAAPLHDIGKIGIPDPVLLKPGKLTVEEFEIIKTHTTIGARILAGSHFPVLQLAEEISLTHHERWDGAGYPRGLKGEAIPLSGRIVAVADAFDAMTNRPYRKPLPMEEAWAALRDGAGTQWDKSVVETFVCHHRTQAEAAGSAGETPAAGAEWTDGRRLTPKRWAEVNELSWGLGS